MKTGRIRLAGMFLILSLLMQGIIGGLAFGAEEKFPRRPLEAIVGFAQGGGVDLIMRIIAEAAVPLLGQKIVIVNKPGAAGVIGVNAVAQARPDGYTIGGTNPAALTMTPHVSNVGYTLNDFTYVTLLTTSPGVFCCNADFPFKDAKDFFAHARQNPGKFTYACDGIGGSMHFTAERIFKAMNVKLRPVPYGGAGESMKALLGRQVDLYSGSVPPILPHVKAGTVRGLFASTIEGAPEIPGCVGVTALGHPEAATVSWKGVIAPKGLPQDRYQFLERVLQKTAQSELAKKRIRELGEKAEGWSGKAFEDFVRSEYKVFAVVAQGMDIRKQ